MVIQVQNVSSLDFDVVKWPFDIELFHFVSLLHVYHLFFSFMKKQFVRCIRLPKLEYMYLIYRAW